MKTHTALRYHRFGAPEDCLSLESAPLGLRSENALRVEMRLAPVNPSDLIPITGAYRHRVQPPQVAGYEGIGHVIEAPAAYQHLIGQRVLPLRGGGTWQTHIDADPALAIPVPDDIPDALAARAYINPLAAYLMLKSWPVKDRHVLLTGPDPPAPTCWPNGRGNRGHAASPGSIALQAERLNCTVWVWRLLPWKMPSISRRRQKGQKSHSTPLAEKQGP